MKTNIRHTLIAVAVLATMNVAYATQPGNNGGGNGGCGVGQQTNGCGGQGGTGGAGGDGGKGGTGVGVGIGIGIGQGGTGIGTGGTANAGVVGSGNSNVKNDIDNKNTNIIGIGVNPNIKNEVSVNPVANGGKAEASASSSSVSQATGGTSSAAITGTVGGASTVKVGDQNTALTVEGPKIEGPKIDIQGDTYNMPKPAAAPAIAPSMTQTATCVRGASVALQIAAGGFSAGGGDVVDFCESIEVAKEARQQGKPELAEEIMCDVPKWRKAQARLAKAGKARACLEDTQQPATASSGSSNTNEVRVGTMGPTGQIVQ